MSHRGGVGEAMALTSGCTAEGVAKRRLTRWRASKANESVADDVMRGAEVRYESCRETRITETEVSIGRVRTTLDVSS